MRCCVCIYRYDTCIYEMDWILDTQRLMSIHKNCLREELPYLTIKILYISNQSKHLPIRVEQEVLHFTEKRIITKEKIKEITQKYDRNDFKLKDLFLFLISVEPEELPLFSENHHKSFTTTFDPVLLQNELLLPPSIFIFHPLNTLYFIYYENMQGSSTRSTKRVRWGDDVKTRTTRHAKR